MNDFDLTNGITITIENTDISFHSYNDWGLYVANSDCIGEPELVKEHIYIPGRDGFIDLSEVTTGRRVYKKRHIKIDLAGFRDTSSWQSVLSTFRNIINGRVCQIIFDNDMTYFWRGRVEIKDFSNNKEYGRFAIDIPDADPYKYNVESSAEPWLWDPFDFETGIVHDGGEIEVDGTETITIPAGYMYVCPEISVSMTSTTFSVIYHGKTYALANGTNRIPQILINGDDEETLTFVGDGTVILMYRGGSL